MGIVYLVLFALAEILLVVLTFTKFQEKAAWQKNKVIIRAAEIVILLGMILLPVVHMKWRFFAVLGLVVVRFIFAGIMWLIKHKKATGMKKKAWSAINCVVSVILAAIAILPSLLFANYNGLPTKGSYNVKETSAILIDKSRVDPFETDGSYREIPAHFYYPENAEGEYPLVLFSHGAFGYYQSNYSTYAELASNGYVVAALDHPHHSFFTKDTNDKVITVDQDFINNVISIDESTGYEQILKMSQEWINLRVDDEKYVLDTIESAKNSKSLDDTWFTDDKETIISVLGITDTDKIGLMGHSLGGAVSVTVGRERDDIDAVIDMDGNMFGEITGIKNGKFEYYTDSYSVPLLALFTENNYNTIEADPDGGLLRVNRVVIDNAKDGKITCFSNAKHMDFTDLPLFSPFLGSMLGHGDVDSEEMMTTVNGVVLDWFNYYLKGEGELEIQSKY